MIATKKLRIIGTSLGITIDKIILKKLKLKEGDFVQVNIKKVEE